jgi:oxygen-independent coproporphyrinogen-3 oxidase
LIEIKDSSGPLRPHGGMQPSLQPFAERAVPRYTSYPTAPHFKPGVGPSTYAAWLEQMPPSARASIYLHVPFCRSLCHYCGCHTKAARQLAPIDEYAGDLAREIRLLAGPLLAQPVRQIHWGGGTPSILGPDNLLALNDELERTFSTRALREHAIELDPRYVNPPLVHALARIGVTRASLGVQDLSPHVQHAIGRVQPYETVRRSVELLREAGILSINIDLMYGLPHQTSEDVRATAAQVCGLRPQRIALFGYAHVPWFKPQQRLIETAALPDADRRLQQAEVARTVLLANGYQAIGLDHFALPDDDLAVASRTGRLHRNFQGYTSDDGDVLIGLGASAIGQLSHGFVQNAPDVGGYARAVRAGRFATARGLALSDNDRVRAAIIERIMCDLRVDLGAVPGAQDGAAFAAELHSLAPLAAKGLVQIDNASICVTERGRPFVRLIAAVFDAYLPAGGRAHSLAV